MSRSPRKQQPYKEIPPLFGTASESLLDRPMNLNKSNHGMLNSSHFNLNINQNNPHFNSSAPAAVNNHPGPSNNLGYQPSLGKSGSSGGQNGLKSSSYSVINPKNNISLVPLLT